MLIGESESEFFDCKREVYDLKKDISRYELAKDVSAFAQARRLLIRNTSSLLQERHLILRREGGGIKALVQRSKELLKICV